MVSLDSIFKNPFEKILVACNHLKNTMGVLSNWERTGRKFGAEKCAYPCCNK
jgi:hypothetical protein